MECEKIEIGIDRYRGRKRSIEDHRLRGANEGKEKEAEVHHLDHRLC